MTSQSVRGRFVWHELTARDDARARTFYARVLGWRTVPWEQDPSYSMFAADGGPLAGCSASASPGAVAHWTPYVGTPDIEATVRQAASLGASIKTAVTALPDGGKYAVLGDPQGATFGVHWSAREPASERPAARGEFSWHELAAIDYRAGFAFYSALFGWDRMAEHDMGPMGIYLIFGRNGTQLGGMFNKGDMGRPGGAYWLGYVRVKNARATADAVQTGGGTIAHAPSEVPGGDLIAQFVDPDGALFAVHTPAADIKAAAGATAPARKKAAKAAASKTKKKKKAAKKRPAKKKTAKKKAKKKAAAKKRGAARKASNAPKRKASKKSKKTGKKKRAAAKKKPAAKRKATKKKPGAKKKRAVKVKKKRAAKKR